MEVTVGVLALQGAFKEHLLLLHLAAACLASKNGADDAQYIFTQVRTPSQLDTCDALIIPGGESTTMALVAARSNLLEPLRQFVKGYRKPTWGTCAGLILLAESANRTKKGGQDLIGGLDVRVNRNHFGRQTESFQAHLDLPFLASPHVNPSDTNTTFHGIFIRAPIVEKILPWHAGVQTEEEKSEATIVAPSQKADGEAAEAAVEHQVEILAKLPGRTSAFSADHVDIADKEAGDIIAVRQGNVFGTSFHPELTSDPRIHVWWLEQVRTAVEKRRHIEQKAHQ
ncbi:MAG: hypothetical protein M1834_002136 [Cirrosporium novae-zelandiae]|nr:MAG: hypothetical protein M1834_002136 [Cirrosporium novae-zelandiae]